MVYFIPQCFSREPYRSRFQPRNPFQWPHLHKRNFRYENDWKLEPGFKDFLTNSWQQRSEITLLLKLTSCVEDIAGWSGGHCHKLKHDIDDCRRQLNNTHVNFSSEGQSQMIELRRKMNRLLAQDDAYWSQLAKTHWYRDGDRNTKFSMPSM